MPVLLSYIRCTASVQLKLQYADDDDDDDDDDDVVIVSLSPVIRHLRQQSQTILTHVCLLQRFSTVGPGAFTGGPQV